MYLFCDKRKFEMSPKLKIPAAQNGPFLIKSLKKSHKIFAEHSLKWETLRQRRTAKLRQ
jgi:hypothetical protein